MKKIFILITMCALLGGCAPKVVWTKPDGFTQQDYNQDSYACEKDVRQSGHFDNGITGTAEMQNFFNECMVAHGWVQQQQVKYSPARKQYDESLKASFKEFTVVMQECADERKRGELKNHRESVKCSNPRAKEIFEHNGFPRMDIVEQFTEKRLEVAKMVDKKQITEAQEAKELASYGKSIFLSGQPE